MLKPHNENLTVKKDCSRNFAQRKTTENMLTISCHDVPCIFKSEEVIEEFNQNEKNMSRKPSFSPLQGISSSVQSSVSHAFENDFVHSSIVTQDQETQMERPYKCNACGKSFDYCSLLSQPWIIHTAIKAYKCDVGGKVFGQHSYMALFQRIITGKKSYTCKECGKTFCYCSLLSHQITNTGAKPYKCEVCGRNFSQSSSLKCHQRIHTGEKPYKCKECGKAFHHKTTLSSHQKIHNRQKAFQSNECRKTERPLDDHLTEDDNHRGEAILL